MSPDAHSAPGDAGSASKRRRSSCFTACRAAMTGCRAVLSFGQDPRWRRAMVDAVAPRRGERVLDVATGTGMVAAELAQARATARSSGLDQSAEMLAAARRAFRERTVARVELVEGQAEALPFEDESFDALTFTYLLRYVDDPPATLRELARVVRPGRACRLARVRRAPRRPARAAWRLYTASGCRRSGGSPRASGARSGGSSGRASPASTSAIRWSGSSATGSDAGLRDVKVRRMSLGGGVVMSATGTPARAAGADARSHA